MGAGVDIMNRRKTKTTGTTKKTKTKMTTRATVQERGGLEGGGGGGEGF